MAWEVHFICIKERLGLAEKIKTVMDEKSDNRPPIFRMTIPVHVICKANSSSDEPSIDRICEK